MKAFFIIFSFLLWTVVSAQKIYMPRNIQAAYAKDTRSLSGAPGKNYWQNGGDYNISFTIQADTRVISGKQQIIYYNNSRDSLNQLVIRFVNNIHKPTSARSHNVPKDFLTSGLHLRSFVANGQSYNLNSNDWGTVYPVRLRKIIPPGSKPVIEMEWDYPLSKLSGREGQIDSATFFCAYAYPRISVYDDYNGWDLLPHTDGQEFYNDFNNYQVSITAPKNYVVWATGVFQNPKEVLQPRFAERFAASLQSDELIHIASRQEMQQRIVTQQNSWNTWKFRADNVSDFCFATSNHFIWDAGSIAISDRDLTRRVSVQAAYNDTATDFKQYIDWEKYCIKWFSENWPGVAYPYPTMTAVQGFADMEYPMMVNDASLQDLKDSRLTVDHEVAHSYFPFYMGTNETRYAFMDEGWATTFEYLIGMSENGKQWADSAYKSFRIKNWISNPATEMDQPLITLSSQLSGAGYGRNSYGKASLSYLALKDLLGDAIFKKALHHYMDNWHGKHPMPWDYFYSINTGSGKNLNWFWHNWFFTNNYIDLKVARVSRQSKGYTLVIDNIGGFAVPFDVRMSYADGSEKSVHITPGVWRENIKRATIRLVANKQIHSLVVDGGIFLDAKPEDNSWRVR